MRLRTDGIATQTLDGETIVLDLQNSQYLSVNETGTYLLGLLGVDRTQDELVAQLASTFQVSQEAAAQDVATFVDRLRSLSLILDQSG